MLLEIVKIEELYLQMNVHMRPRDGSDRRAVMADSLSLQHGLHECFLPRRLWRMIIIFILVKAFVNVNWESFEGSEQLGCGG